MANRYIVEKEFNHNGLKCVVTFSNMGHRCGYVGVPKWHPLYGKDCMDYLDIKKEDIEGKEVSGVFPLLGALIDNDERVRIEAYFTCHGGITYSGGGENSTYPIESNLSWFGFDCAHYGDGKDLDLAIEVFPEYAEQIARTKEIENMFPTYELARSTEYVSENCKELADQLAQLSCIVK